MTQQESLDTRERVLEMLKQKQPEFMRLAAPRRYLTPYGYFDPKHFATTLYSSALTVQMIQSGKYPPDASTVVCYVVTRSMLDYQVPQYFVKESLLNDLVLTEPPKDLCLDENFKWPIPALSFMLPKSFSLRYFGMEMLSLAVCRRTPGVLPTRFCTELGPVPPVETDIAKIGIYSEVFDPSGHIYGYSNSQHIDGTSIEKLCGVDEDINYYDRCFCGLADQPDPAFFNKDDKLILQRITSLVIKLLLVMVARPTLVSEGTCQRPAKEKRGRVKEALWTPRYVGEKYVSRMRAPDQGGTHASPRIHWRTGHWRNQAFGPGRADHKVLWIEPMMVGGDEITS